MGFLFSPGYQVTSRAWLPFVRFRRLSRAFFPTRILCFSAAISGNLETRSPPKVRSPLRIFPRHAAVLAVAGVPRPPWPFSGLRGPRCPRVRKLQARSHYPGPLASIPLWGFTLQSVPLAASIHPFGYLALLPFPKAAERCSGNESVDPDDHRNNQPVPVTLLGFVCFAVS